MSVRVGETLLIQPEDRPALLRALNRALVAGVTSDWIDHYTTFRDGESVDQLLVTSSSVPGCRHPVSVRVRGREVYTRCECMAGRSCAICQHVALGLWVIGLLREREIQ